MQNNQCKLKEIIWEITGECKNNCVHCGSKEVFNIKTSENNIKAILESIAKYPPEQINISGGDPLLVSFELHERIVKRLKSVNTICKIIVNPKSINKKCNILNLYDYIGISINDVSEINFFIETMMPACKTELHDKITIISNFNLSNIFAYDEIDKFVKENNFGWQIQFTVFKDKSSLALYENDDAINFLQNKINSSIANGTKLIVADNMNNGQCSAGLYSCGILANGYVVPCLSMRSWVHDIDLLLEGNLLKACENPLKKIWENGFKDYRYSQFKCCKDHCKNKIINICLPTINLFEESTSIQRVDAPKRTQEILLYGVNPNIVQMYAVIDTRIMAYAVITQPMIRCAYGVSVFESPQPMIRCAYGVSVFESPSILKSYTTTNSTDIVKIKNNIDENDDNNKK